MSTPYLFDDRPYYTKDIVRLYRDLQRLSLQDILRSLSETVQTPISLRYLQQHTPLETLYTTSFSLAHLHSNLTISLSIENHLLFFVLDQLFARDPESPFRAMTAAEHGVLSALMLSSLETLHETMQLLPPSHPRSKDISIFYECQLGSKRGIVRVSYNADHRLVVRPSPDEMLPLWLQELSVPVRVVVGVGLLSQEEFSSLTHSDILFPELLWLSPEGEGHAWLHAASLWARCILPSERLVEAMSTQEPPVPTADPRQLRVTVELCHFSAKLDELANWKRDSIVPLHRKPGEPVLLFVENTLVARGELVRIDDELGVKLSWVAP